jgi:hypothetical protein
MMFAENEFEGTYEGWYYANQGQTGLTLTIKDGEGVFEFYNMPGKSNAANGSYTVTVKENEENNYRIDGVEWIEKPSTYSFVYLDGVLDEDKYTGNVNGNRSWEFVLTKNNSEYKVKVDYIDELPSWLPETSSKSVQFTLVEVNGEYQIKAMNIISQSKNSL